MEPTDPFTNPTLVEIAAQYKLVTSQHATALTAFEQAQATLISCEDQLTQLKALKTDLESQLLNAAKQ